MESVPVSALLSVHVKHIVYDCVMILTAIKVRTLGDVAIGSKNQLHILDNALATQRRCRVNTERDAPRSVVLCKEITNRHHNKKPKHGSYSIC